VRADGAPIAVLEHGGGPAVRLAAGTVRLEGSYRWNDIPQRIRIPREIGILALVIDGKPVEAPVWDTQGFVWLKRDGSTEEADTNFLGVKFHAAVEDGIPLWWHTEIELTVAGKSREEDIGTVLPEGWKLAAVNSSIPVAVDETGRMKAQVRAGKWTVQVDAFRFDNPKEIRYAEGARPASDEQFVAFQAQPDLRTVEILGPPAIDVSQTTFPAKWRELPVYRWDTATPFRLEERLRGMGEQKPAGLTIARELWLDENGRGLTFRDQITGTMQQIWRLDAADGQDLGSVRSDGEGLLITRNPKNEAPGVEIRKRDLRLEATGRMDRTNAVSATGWRSDADALNVTLNLPPGWRLFALFGADWVRGDWLTAWTLLDLFLLLVFALAVFRLWGLWPGLLAFLAFGLSYHEPGAPRYLWLVLIIPLALQRVVPAGWGRRLLGAGKWIAIALFVLALVPFVARQVQQALYPQLEIVGTGDGRRLMSLGQFQEQSEVPNASAPNDILPGFDTDSTEAMNRKLDQIIIPKLELREATVREAVEILKAKSVELDTDSPAGERGVNIVLKLEGVGAEAPGVPGLDPVPAFGSSGDSRITVSLTNIPLREALKYVTGLANLKFKVERYAVSVVPLTENTDVFVTKEWTIPPDLVPRLPLSESAPAFGGGKGIADRESSKNWLIANGVTFNGQASSVYIVRSNRLIVRNTQDQVDLIDTIIREATGAKDGGSRKGSSSKLNLNYDTKARIQTGPGVPEWKWRAVSFGWNGPVSATQQVKPVLISLTLERILTALRVLLLLALAAVLLDARRLGKTFAPPSR
jgi:hypothetical protein